MNSIAADENHGDESVAAPSASAAPNVTTPDDQVAGERRIGSINQVRSLQSRVSHVLAVGLLSVLAVGFLGWYYVHTYTAQRQVRRTAELSSQGQAQGDMPLPSLGPIDPPTLRSADSSLMEQALGTAPDAPPDDIPQAWLAPAEDPAPVTVGASTPAKTPEQLALERKLAGTAFSRAVDSAILLTGAAMPAGMNTAGVQGGADGVSVGDAGDAGQSELSGLLKPGVTPAARARVLPTLRLLLPKGAFIDCTLETAIDSTLPGMTTCVTATDTFGADGSTVLLERGTKLVGETRGQVQQGAARVFVLWNEARTPTGVVIPLASPGTDELGRSGVAGRVNHHFFERFGAAILISMIDGVVQGAVQSSGGGTVIYNPSASENIMTEVLKSTVNIAPTVTKAHGDRIQVLVARDLDFRSVYELRPAHVR
jgi:type IV secretion system protein VirB10